mmetsp:Transcript_20841/g.43847  ORF Transcript_20841/g.43847 Transcript_20841/m.43847 type:complete len:331 (-) Transcript_20841:105-1097(-)
MKLFPVSSSFTPPTATLWRNIPQICSGSQLSVKINDNVGRHRCRHTCCFFGSSSAASFPSRNTLQSPCSFTPSVKAIVADSDKNIRRKAHTHAVDQHNSNHVKKSEFTLQQRPSSFDPTAKRPTQKCDPFGLQGQSLSYSECIEWMPTLEEGWELISFQTESCESRDKITTSKNPPTFLQKKFYHSSFHEASQFLAHITLLATNNNHYPYLAMERVLVDDTKDLHGQMKSGNNHNMTNGGNQISDGEFGNENASDSKRKRRKIKGWAFVSTVRCSSYRPPTTKREENSSNKNKENEHIDKGLTYHDFHLAMNIDIEVNRKEVRRWLWQEP